MKKEVCAKVYKTTDYSAFRFLDTNRDPRTYKHVIKSINKIGWQHDPILVNEKNEIIDGQNRFLACKELGLPIEFMVQVGATIETARSMNVGQKNWVPMDYVKSFAADGDQNYQLIKNLAERWRGRVALPGLAWCVSPTMSKGSQSGTYSNIASGNFKCSIRQYNYVNMALEDLDALKILDFADAYKMSAKTWIPTAFYAYMHPDVDISRFGKQIWKRPELIPACTTTAEQLDRVSAAYNAGLAKKKNVYLKTDYERGEHLDIKQAIIRGRKKY